MAIDFNKFSNRILVDMLANVSESGLIIEGYMKLNAPWQDRTGDARGTLQCRLDEVQENLAKGMIVLKLSDGMKYFQYLELAHEKKYAIIQPTIATQSHIVFDSFKNFINKYKL